MNPEQAPEVHVLFVCMGNICRSPTAQAVLRAQAGAAGLAERIGVDSAGTHGYHVGLPPDPRAVRAAAGRGYELADLRARQVEAEDLDRFELVVAMDRANLERLERLAGGQGGTRPRLLLDHVEYLRGREVPDPYYGGARGFERMLDLIEEGCAGLLAEIRRGRGW